MNLDKIDYNKLQKLSEKTLRKCIIIPLLDDVGAENVKDMHGPTEEGIDVYFETNDIFGHKRRFGIQIKKGNISSPAYPNKKNVKTILSTICNQIKMAFSKDIILVDSECGKINAQVDGYYIFVSGRVNENARNYIYQNRETYPFIHIIDGDGILKIIKKRKYLRKIKLGKAYGHSSTTTPNNYREEIYE